MLSDMMHEKQGRSLLYTMEVPVPSSPSVTVGISTGAGGGLGVGVVCKNRLFSLSSKFVVRVLFFAHATFYEVAISNDTARVIFNI